MSVPIWCVAAGAPFLMSLGYLAGEFLAYTTTREIDAAWMLLGLRVRQFLEQRRSGRERFDPAELAALSEAIQLLEELNELPQDATVDADENQNVESGAA